MIKDVRMRTKSVEEITLKEMEQMNEFRKKSAWNDNEKIALVNLVRTYIDPHQESCMSCNSGANLIEARRKVGTYYLLHIDSVKKRIELIDNQPEQPENEFERATKEVDDYADVRKCYCGNELKDKRYKYCSKECKKKKKEESDG